jgi:hypothetical protein
MSRALSVESLFRLGLLVVGLLAALACLAVQGSRPGRGLTDLPLYDFVEYWAAGRLVLQGDNPYDVVRVGELQKQIGHTADPILMWNPPWALPLVVPLGLFDVRTAHLLWMLGHLLVIVACADVLWRHYGGSRDSRAIAWLVALGFLPSILALLAGQISPLLLLGATGFLVFVRCRRDTLAGAATVLLAIKPHLALLFWLALLVWVVRERRWKILVGGALAGLALTGVALLFDPAVFGQYRHTTLTTPPAQYRSPTLGTLLRLAVGNGAFGLQFVALLPGLLWVVPYLLRHKGGWDWDRELPLLLLVSFLTATYGAWPFDLVVLLVPVLRVAVGVVQAGRPWLALAIFLAFNILGGLQLACEVEWLWFLWMTPVVFGAYLLLGSSAGTAPVSLRYTNQPQQPTPVAG